MNFFTKLKRKNKVYKLEQNYIYNIPYSVANCQILDSEKTPVLFIKKGQLIIFPGYTWDGCTPKFNFLDLFWIGIPDGIIDIETGKPKLYYATLIHDILNQYHTKLPFTRKQIDDMFLDCMGNFKLKWVYYFFVRVFGWLFWI